MKRFLITLFLALTFCSSSYAVDELDATKPANSDLISTYPGYLRETRTTVNEIIDSLDQAYIGTNGSYGYVGVANSGKITWSSASPTDGTWSVGDICFNSASSTKNDYWICSTAGTPGTWRRSDYSDTLSNTELANFVPLADVKRNINQADENYGRSTTATNVTASTTSSVFGSGNALLLTSVTSTNSYLLGYTTLLNGLSAGYYTFVFDLNVISATTATVATSTSGDSYTTTLAQGHHIVSIPFHFDGSTNTNCSVVVSTPSAGTQCSIESIRVLSGVKSISTMNTLILASSVPASGTWLKGDKAFSTADSRGMWACTAGGTPGTWVVANGDVSKVGTPTNHQVGIWTGDGTLKGLSVTGSKVMCTDANGEPVACTNLTDTLLTGVTGIVKSNGTTFSAAVAGTDYVVMDNVRSIGEWSGDLDAAVASLDVVGNAGEDFVIVIDQATSMSDAVDLSDLDHAASITLAFLSPAGVITTNDHTLTIPNQIPKSVSWKILNVTSSTNIVFAKNAGISFINMAWWGLVSDADLAGAGTDNSTAIQNCLDIIDNGSYDNYETPEIYVPVGKYLHSSGLTVYTGTKLIGNGVLRNRDQYPVFYYDGGAGTACGVQPRVIIEGIAFIGENTAGTVGITAVDGSDMLYSEFRNVMVRNFATQVIVDGYINTFTQCDLYASSASSTGLLITGSDCNDNNFISCQFRVNSSASKNVNIENGDKISFSQCIFEPNAKGIYINGASVYQINITDSRFEILAPSASYFIQVTSTSTNANVVINNNNFYDGGANASSRNCYAIYVAGGSVSVSGNICFAFDASDNTGLTGFIYAANGVKSLYVGMNTLATYESYTNHRAVAYEHLNAVYATSSPFMGAYAYEWNVADGEYSFYFKPQLPPTGYKINSVVVDYRALNRTAITNAGVAATVELGYQASSYDTDYYCTATNLSNDQWAETALNNWVSIRQGRYINSSEAKGGGSGSCLMVKARPGDATDGTVIISLTIAQIRWIEQGQP